jgi:hypothetical protein
MSMPGNGTLEVAEHQKQLSSQQQRLLDPLRPASGQVTPVFGKAHIYSLCFECFCVHITGLYFCDTSGLFYVSDVYIVCDVSCQVFVVSVVHLTVVLWALHYVLIHNVQCFGGVLHFVGMK